MGMLPNPAGATPLRIVGEDEGLRGFDDITGTRNPVEVGDCDLAAMPEHAKAFGGGARTIEPVPALAGGDDVEGARTDGDLFG